MKKFLSFILVLVTLLGILTSCAPQAVPSEPTESQHQNLNSPGPESETEPTLAEPPRTPEDFLAQFNARIQENGIPLEFSFLEPEDQGDHYWVPCAATHVGDGTPISSDGITLWVKFTDSLSGKLLAVELYMGPEYSKKTQELHRRLCLTASLLCDEHMDANTAHSLYGPTLVITEPTVAVYEDGVWVQSIDRSVDSYDNDTVYRLTYRFCQPEDITHTLVTSRNIFVSNTTDWQYQILFTEAPEAALTVGELEAAINTYFTQQGLPLECIFRVEDIQWDHSPEPYIQSFNEDDGYRMNDGDQSYARWQAYFHFTSLDDPNISYPVLNPDKTYGYSPEPEFYDVFVCKHCFPIFLELTAKGISSDAVVCNWQFSNRFRLYQGGNELLAAPWDESWDSIAQQFMYEICDLWCREMEDDTVNDFLTAELSGEETPEKADLDTDLYQISWNSFEFFDFDKINLAYIPYANKAFVREQRSILDPQRLDCPFTFNKPIIQDGLFFVTDAYTGRYRYRTDKYRTYKLETDIPYLLEEYLFLTGSELQFVAYDYVEGQHVYNEIRTIDGTAIDKRYLGVKGYDLIEEDYATRVGFEDEMYCVYYSENAECPVDVDNMIALAVGLSQICDEEMTVEEAITLHTQQQEVMATYEGWQISCIAPRNVTHIICKDTVTGMTRYYVLPKELFDSYTESGTLEDFAILFL